MQAWQGVVSRFCWGFWFVRWCWWIIHWRFSAWCSIHWIGCIYGNRPWCWRCWNVYWFFVVPLIRLLWWVCRVAGLGLGYIVAWLRCIVAWLGCIIAWLRCIVAWLGCIVAWLWCSVASFYSRRRIAWFGFGWSIARFWWSLISSLDFRSFDGPIAWFRWIIVRFCLWLLVSWLLCWLWLWWGIFWGRGIVLLFWWTIIVLWSLLQLLFVWSWPVLLLRWSILLFRWPISWLLLFGRSIAWLRLWRWPIAWSRSRGITWSCWWIIARAGLWFIVLGLGWFWWRRLVCCLLCRGWFVLRLGWRGWLVCRLGWFWRIVSWPLWRGLVVCRFLLIALLLWRSIRLWCLCRWWSVNNMNRRRVVGLIDQYRQFVVGQWHVFNCWWCFVFSSVSSIRVRWLWWRREMNYRWFLSRVDNGSSIFHLWSVKFLRRIVGLL